MPDGEALTEQLTQVGESAAVATWLLLLLTALIIGAVFGWGWWLTNRHGSKNPYTGTPLAPAKLLPFQTVEKLQAYLSQVHDAANPFFDLNSAAVCRETGRIFPNAINRFGVIKVDWSFIKKRWPGEWISWGALKDPERQALFARHERIEGFQLKHSSKAIRPRQLEEQLAWEVPGPLYVDPRSATLMGWKRVPGTEIEVLVVQKPSR